MRAVRLLPDGGFEPLPHEEAHFSQRLFWLEDLLRPRPEGPGIAERVRPWLPRSVSLHWFDDAYNDMIGHGQPSGAHDCWAPEEIVEALQALVDILRVHGAELPDYFRFREATGRGMGGYRMFVGGHPYLVRGGWGRCAAVPLDDRGDPTPGTGEEIDLRDEPSIRVHAMFIPLDLRRLGQYNLGPEMTVAIERETCADHFRPDLEEMLRVGRLAARTGNRVFTSID